MFLRSDCDLTNVGLGNCEFVLTKREFYTYSAIPLDDVRITGGDLLNVTIYVHPDILDEVVKMDGITFINHIGIAEIDNRQPKSR